MLRDRPDFRRAYLAIAVSQLPRLAPLDAVCGVSTMFVAATRAARPRPSAADYMTPIDAAAGSRTIGSPVIASIRSAACAAAAAGARRPVRTASSIA